MAYEDAFLTNNAVVFIGGSVSGDTNEGATSIALQASDDTLAEIRTRLSATVDTGTANGWTEISTDGWGFVFGSYPGPSIELAEQGGSSKATFRQSLEVQDLEWTFQVDENVETFKVLGGVQQKRRRFLIFPNGVSSGASYDELEAYISAPTQDNSGRKQYNISVYLNGPVVTRTIA